MNKIIYQLFAPAAVITINMVWPSGMKIFIKNMFKIIKIFITLYINLLKNNNILIEKLIL